MADHKPRSAIDQIERMRNILAFLLVGAFIAVIPMAMLFVIPEKNESLITYAVGQLSGMALLALGFYFVNKVGQDAADAKRADNTGKMADAMKETALAAQAVTSPEGPKDLANTKAAERVADAAVDEADNIRSENE